MYDVRLSKNRSNLVMPDHSPIGKPSSVSLALIKISVSHMIIVHVGFLMLIFRPRLLMCCRYGNEYSSKQNNSVHGDFASACVRCVFIIYDSSVSLLFKQVVYENYTPLLSVLPLSKNILSNILMMK